MNSEYEYLFNKYKPKTNKFDICFKVVVLLFLGSFVSIFLYLFITINPLIENFNNLTNKISNQLDYYQSIVSLHNTTLFEIESKINNIVNKNEIPTIIDNLNRITSELNVTLIQNDLNTIANDLTKVIPH
jgi:predicted PurR-regulated permease PerM